MSEPVGEMLASVCHLSGATAAFAEAACAQCVGQGRDREGARRVLAVASESGLGQASGRGPPSLRRCRRHRRSRTRGSCCACRSAVWLPFADFGATWRRSSPGSPSEQALQEAHLSAAISCVPFSETCVPQAMRRSQSNARRRYGAHTAGASDEGGVCVCVCGRDTALTASGCAARAMSGRTQLV